LTVDESQLSIAPRKRRLRFSVRSLLLLTALTAIVLPFVVEGPASKALDGYSPVAVVDEHRWVLGDPQFVERHKGVDYFFASAAERDTFLQNPERFAVAVNGFDVVLAMDAGEERPGSRRHGFRYGGRTYIFSSRASADAFVAAPRKYAKFADAWKQGW
jgi:YHS domain-containing protein